MADLTNPHDRFFKEMLGREEVGRDLVRYYLPPDIVELLDLDTLDIAPGTFVDPGLQEHVSDLLFRVFLQDGRPAAIYLLFEHKSYPDPDVAFQLLRYVTRIWERAREEQAPRVPVFPVVLYHGRAAWQVPSTLQGALDVPSALVPFVPDFRYSLVDLTRFSDEEIRGALALRIALLALKYVFSEELIARLPDIMVLVVQLPERRSVLDTLETLFRYFVAGSKRVEGADLWRAMESLLVEEGRDIMKTLAEEWLEQGREEGLKRGLEQGLQQGLRQGLLEAIALGLDLKFGADGLRLLPDLYAIQDVAILRAVSQALRSVTTPDELQRVYRRE